MISGESGLLFSGLITPSDISHISHYGRHRRRIITAAAQRYWLSHSMMALLFSLINADHHGHLYTSTLQFSAVMVQFIRTNQHQQPSSLAELSGSARCPIKRKEKKGAFVIKSRKMYTLSHPNIFKEIVTNTLLYWPLKIPITEHNLTLKGQP